MARLRNGHLYPNRGLTGALTDALKAEGWSVEEQPALGTGRPDLLVTRGSHNHVVVELREAREPVHFGTIAQVDRYSRIAEQTRGLRHVRGALATTAPLSDAARDAARKVGVLVLSTDDSGGLEADTGVLARRWAHELSAEEALSPGNYAAGDDSASAALREDESDEVSQPSGSEAIRATSRGKSAQASDPTQLSGHASLDLSVKIFADGADLDGILALAADRRIAGFTTNPTLMWKAGLTDYEDFAKRLLERITTHPISFEVFADDEAEIRRQALKIATWGENVYVKVPVTTTDGTSMAPLARELSESGVNLNVTALFSTAQVELITEALRDGAPAFISVFAGRIADAGVDPMPIMARSVDITNAAPRTQLVWASTREVLNIIQADQIGCHVITATPDLLKKLDGLGKNLEQFSLETVQMFRREAIATGFTIA